MIPKNFQMVRCLLQCLYDTGQAKLWYYTEAKHAVYPYTVT
jgi:hypothetical protein